MRRSREGKKDTSEHLRCWGHCWFLGAKQHRGLLCIKCLRGFKSPPPARTHREASGVGRKGQTCGPGTGWEPVPPEGIPKAPHADPRVVHSLPGGDLRDCGHLGRRVRPQEQGDPSQPGGDPRSGQTPGGEAQQRGRPQAGPSG